jgi:hypothetical protein
MEAVRDDADADDDGMATRSDPTRRPDCISEVDELIPHAPRCRCRVLPEGIEGDVPETETETEWGVRWDEDDGLLPSQAVGERGREEAVKVARIYGYGTPDSRVSLVRRTVTYGPWAKEPEP